MDKHKNVMIQGCASSVGKSLLTGALCRILKQDGYTVAPFKSQNMALNSYITKQGHEMGRAQVVQAEAAGIEPHVMMNPILLKPTSDKKSQIIINGKVHANMDFREYHRIKPTLKTMLKETFDQLSDQYEYVIMEGAGSPAEINLAEGDIVNMGMAEIADAPVILVGDIDKGGVFAFIAGTIQLLKEEERKRVKGVIINKFRGDKTILEPGLRMLEDIIKIPVLGVVPYMDVDIEDEDSVTERFKRVINHGDIDVAVINLPHMSNYTDFNPLSLQNSVTMRYVQSVVDLGEPDLILLPGTKNTIEDLLYLKSSGMDVEIIRHAKHGKAVMGICGGYQMLAQSLSDPMHTESKLTSISGLGLLDMEVTFESEKVTSQVEGKVVSGHGLLEGLKDAAISGYEIHMGRNTLGEDVIPATTITLRNNEAVDVVDGVMNKEGNVFGTYMHGIFDEGSFLRGVINHLRAKKGLEADNSETLSFEAFKEREYNRLAEIVRSNLDMDKVYQILDGEV